jgi:hypothetical protein
METFYEGLRCQDVTLGLRHLDQNEQDLRLVRNTHYVGMAADLAGLIRGRAVIDNIDALEVVASETLGISSMVLPQVLEVLERAELVEIDRRGENITRVLESVPVYRDLYALLGGVWRNRAPRQLEQELLVVVDRVARGPIPVESLTEDLGVERGDVDKLYRLGVDTCLLKTVSGRDGEILYSPYTAFENPNQMWTVLNEHGPGALSDALSRVANYQGYPVVEKQEPVLLEAVARGLVAAPGVVRPSGDLAAFAAIPYAFDQSLTRDKKQILDKALAIVACIRCGQHYGGATSTRDAVLVLQALTERESLRPHGSHERQYKLLRDLGVIRFLPDSRPGGSWKRPSYLRTEENDEAVRLAISLLQGTESFYGREPEDGVKKLLDLDAKSLKPLQSTARSRAARRVLPEAELNRAFETILGRGEL